MLNDIDLSRTDLNLLVLFEAVLEARHVGRAADRLNLSASAVSHGLGRLRLLFQDPLFLRTPKGVVPTDSALRLAPQIAAVLAGVRSMLTTAAPFDPAESKRRFVIGAPDAISAVLVSPLLRDLDRRAPGIDLGIRQVLPKRGAIEPTDAWSTALTDLEARAFDLVVLPIETAPRRFQTFELYREDFVVAARCGHPFLDAPTLADFLAARHILVSETGDAAGIVDVALEAIGLARRVALTVPGFSFALALVAQSDLLCALPRHLITQHGARSGVLAAELPVTLPAYALNLIVPKVALADEGLSWLVEVIRSTTAMRLSATG